MQAALKPFVRILAAGMSLLLIAPLRAQEGTATIAGTILDQAGKVIVAASVTVKSDSAGLGKTVVTDNEGHFSVGGLAPGTYTIETSAPGAASR